MQEIQISSIEIKDGKITLEEQIGGQQYPTRYSFFETFPSGDKTPVFEQFQSLNLKKGDIVTIEVNEVKKTNQFGKEVTYRNITSFNQPDTSDTTSISKTPQKSISSVTGRPTYDPMPKKDIKNTIDYKSRQIAGFQDDKQESMRLFSSGRDAVMIVTEMYKGSTFSDEQIKEKIMEWRKFFYQKVYKMSDDEYKSLNVPF